MCWVLWYISVWWKECTHSPMDSSLQSIWVMEAPPVISAAGRPDPETKWRADKGRARPLNLRGTSCPEWGLLLRRLIPNVYAWPLGVIRLQVLQEHHHKNDSSGWSQGWENIVLPQTGVRRMWQSGWTVHCKNLGWVKIPGFGWNEDKAGGYEVLKCLWL